ncbi:hypothetical protein [Frigoriglobus tundricola]|uniref:Uncharacterized protein n=1 Tax=Frigoriglobus tundricola TaxID=2774151 RepID=A0A6M5YKH7_9BACT|nr:hypothetical protein [Frigoriglobus tundricola]QJW93783.1 hypothetical protein FTUN_1294 [Frigoriglobus tundricola]
MRGAVFRVLAGLLAVAFGSLLAFGDTSKLSLKELFGIGAIGAGFGLYALLGSDLGERLIWVAFGGRDPRGGGHAPADKRPGPEAAPDRGRPGESE